MKAYDIKIRLDKIRPIHWRDLIIPTGITFDDLYYIIQVVYGFKYNHDYKFTFKNSDIIIEGLGDGTPVSYIEDLDDYYLSFSYNLGEYFIIDDAFEVYDKIKLEIHTRDKWEFTIEIKKSIESEYSYPVIKRFKGDYNPLEYGCGKYDFMDMLYLLDHPENSDDEKYNRANAYIDDLKKFNITECQEILRKDFENYFTNNSDAKKLIYEAADNKLDAEEKTFPLRPTNIACINSKVYNAELIGENEDGGAYLHEPLFKENFKKVAFIIGTNPLESKAYRVVFQATNKLYGQYFTTFYVYNINISQKYMNQKEIGEKIVNDYVINHILDNDYDLVIDVHSTIDEVNDEIPSNFIFAYENQELENSLKKLSLIHKLSYYQPDTYSKSVYIQKLLDNKVNVIHFETSSYDPMSISYLKTKSLIKMIEQLYD